jgi:hypothetical protein
VVVFGFGDFDVIQHPNSGSDVINIRHVSVCRCGEAGGDWWRRLLVGCPCVIFKIHELL